MSNPYSSKLVTGESQEKDLKSVQDAAVAKSNGDKMNGANNRAEPKPTDNLSVKGSLK